MKKNMIRMAGLAVSLFLMAGCSGGRGNNISEKDFDIYENGKCIATIEEVEEANKDNSRYFYYTLDGENFFPDRELETRRGIKIGSTVRELTEAYSGEFVWYDNYTLDGGLPREEYVSEYLLVDDFLKQITDYDTKEYSLSFNRWIINSNFLDGLEADEYLKQLGKDFEEIGDVGAISLTLNFDIEDNIVKDIYITRTGY